ncbi:MAG: hypothetical protein H7338_00415 [Candidatus Sericytochromatia bacterium]|nr:hypothetical protein [Candidatus Sericytochromatia bacterium]
MGNSVNRDRLASIPPLPGSGAAPQTATTIAPARGGQQTYTLDQFRGTPGGGGVPGGSGLVTGSDKKQASKADIAGSNDNRSIYAEHIARGRQFNYLMPGATDRRRIITLQQKLNAVGVSVPVTGKFDFNTSVAVRQMKARTNLTDGFVDRNGSYAASDVMTPEAENALQQLATQAGWKPTGPLTDAAATPGWQKAQAPVQGSGTTVPQSPTGAGGTAVTQDEFARYKHMQQIMAPRSQGGTGYPLTPDQRKFYEDVRQRLLANGGVVGTPATPGSTPTPGSNDALAILRQPASGDGPVSAAEAAAADAFEAQLNANPHAFDNQPGIMYHNYLAIRGRQQTAGTQEAPGAPAATQYAVKQGDTFQSIAEKLTGSSSNWKSIYDANADRLASWQAQRPQMTKQFNEYYGTTMVPNPYLLPKGFQLTIGGGAPADPDVSAPVTNGKTPKATGTSTSTSAKGGNAPKTTWSSEAVDVPQYRWLMANKDAYEAGTLSPKDKEAFEKIANKVPVTPELDALLKGESGSGNDVGAAPGSSKGAGVTVDVNDPDPDLQAALAILKKQQSGGQITAEERAQYRQLMGRYRARTFEGG